MQIQSSVDRSPLRIGRTVLMSLAALVALIGGPCAAWAAPKTDVVELVNGDRITGEIKSMEYNKLKLSTYHIGTIYIEWDKIRRLQTRQFLLLERADGSRYYGQLVAGDSDAQLQVRGKADRPPEAVEMATVVRAQPIEGGDFIDRLDGYVSAGFDLSESGDNTSTNFSGGLSSRTRIREWNVDLSAGITDDGEERTERYDLSGLVRRPLRGPNYYEGMLIFNRNTELELNLRSMVGGGLGRYLVRSNRAEWRAGAGLAYSHENFQGQDQQSSIEAMLGTEFSIFRYDFPETDIGGTLILLPSLTKSGRYRSEAELHVNYEFVEDLYFEFRMYGSFDSEPPDPDAPRDDYGFVTSLGYKF